jgi:hypothetical protein
VLNKKEMTDIFKLAKTISLTSDDEARAELFKVSIQHSFVLKK